MPLSIDADALTLAELDALIHQRSCEADEFLTDTLSLVKLRDKKRAIAEAQSRLDGMSPAERAAYAQLLGPIGIEGKSKVGETLK